MNTELTELTPRADNARMLSNLSRRSVVKTAAWTAPVVAVAVAAPSAAASPQVTVNSEIWAWAGSDGVNVNGEGADGKRRYMTITGTTADSVITEPTIELFISVEGRPDGEQAPALVWAQGYDGDLRDWTVPTAMEVVTLNGRRARRYVMRYTGTVTPTSPATTIPVINVAFQSSPPQGTDVYITQYSTVNVDGQPVTGTAGAWQRYGGLTPAQSAGLPRMKARSARSRFITPANAVLLRG